MADHLQAVLRRLLTETDAYVALEEGVLVVDGRVDLDPDEVAAVRTVLTGSPLPAVEYSLTQTCAACPTQYDVELEDGRYAYFRFRHGYASLKLYRNQEAFGGIPESSWGEQTSDVMDGVMEHDAVVALVAEHLPRLVQEAGA